MKKLVLTMAFLLPIIVFAQKAPNNKSSLKSTIKKSTKTVAPKPKIIDTAQQMVIAARDTTTKTPKPDSLTKKTVSNQKSKPNDSLAKKIGSTKKTKPVDSLIKKSLTAGKGKPIDSIAKKTATTKKSKAVDSVAKKSAAKKNIKPADTIQKPKALKGWFEISGVDSTDLKETQLKKNAVEWFTNWFSPLNDRYPTFKSSVADSLNQVEGYFRGHGSNVMEDNYNPSSISKMTMSYKTEVSVIGKTYQFRFYDFKIKSTLVQNGKLIIDETITNIDEEKEKYRKSPDPFKGWRLKKLQNEVQLILDSFQTIMMQTPQRLNAFE